MDKAEERDQRTGAEGFSAPARSLASPLRLPESLQEEEKAFNTLPAQNQIALILGTRGKERLHYLLLSKDPEPLVQQLPELELFLTVKELGERDALSLLSLTAPEQFQFLLDLEFWKRDELDPGRILHWLEILLDCGEKKIAQFIQSADSHFIALLLKKFLRINTLEGEPVEVGDELPPFTLDHFYFIHFTEKGARPVLERFLKIFSLIETERYQELMEALIWELDSELEEGEYRLRNARLSEHGFPEFEEALEIYRFIPPDSLIPKGKAPSIVKQEGGEEARSTFYLTFLDEKLFFSSILARLDGPSDQDRLKIEMTALCNKAMVAEATDLSRFEEIERVTRKVVHTLNLGLEYLSGQEETRALGILQSVPLQRLFQGGFSLTLLLKRKTETLLNGPWFGGNRENLLFLDPPYLERFEGILEKRPSLHRNGVTGDFKNLKELKETEDLVNTAETVVHLLDRQLNVSPGFLRNLDLTGCHPDHWRLITVSTLFITAMANQVLKGSFRFEAVEAARLKDLFSRLFVRDEQGKGFIKMEIRNGLKEWLDSIEVDENRRDRLLAFRDFCIDLLESEFGKIPPGEEPDPRFVKGLLICR